MRQVAQEAREEGQEGRQEERQEDLGRPKRARELDGNDGLANIDELQAGSSAAVPNPNRRVGIGSVVAVVASEPAGSKEELLEGEIVAVLDGLAGKLSRKEMEWDVGKVELRDVVGRCLSLPSLSQPFLMRLSQLAGRVAFLGVISEALVSGSVVFSEEDVPSRFYAAYLKSFGSHVDMALRLSASDSSSSRAGEVSVARAVAAAAGKGSSLSSTDQSSHYVNSQLGLVESIESLLKDHQKSILQIMEKKTAGEAGSEPGSVLEGKKKRRKTFATADEGKFFRCLFRYFLESKHWIDDRQVSARLLFYNFSIFLLICVFPRSMWTTLSART